MESIGDLDPEVLATNYTELSDDLSYARTFYPRSDVVSYLNRLLADYQVNVNSGRRRKAAGLFTFWGKEFPLLIGQERKVMLFVLLFFIFSGIVGAFSAEHEVSFVRLILGNAYVNQTLDNIAGGKPMGIYNSMDEWDMFVNITTNNIRVSFTVFVFGLFFSAGSLWILFTNGLMLGAFQYFFYQHDLLLHSALSVWAHGTFEITSIIIAGGAGIVMGNSFLFPGTYTRLQSFRSGALRGIKIVAGLIPFFIIAGIIESFVTRYADSYPAMGACVVVISLIGVVAYFVVYPYKIMKSVRKKTVDLNN